MQSKSKERLHTLVRPETHAWLRIEAARQRLSTGALIDKIVTRAAERVIRCPACEGDGVFYVGDPATATETEACERCHGTGRVLP